MATVPKTLTTLEIQQIIRDIAQDYAKCMNARDVDRLVAFYAPDGRILAPFKPMVQGPMAIRHLTEEMYKETDPRNVKIETEYVEVNENLAFSVGTFAMDAMLPTGKRVDYRGKWVTTLRGDEGKDWKIVFHIYNGDLPISDYMTK